MSELVYRAIDCDFGVWPKSVMIATATRTEQLKAPSDLEFRVKVAVADWLKSTPQGRAAYEASSQNFNTGDLLQHVDEPSLVARLADQGVSDFELSLPVQLVSWYHDEPLFQETV